MRMYAQAQKHSLSERNNRFAQPGKQHTSIVLARRHSSLSHNTHSADSHRVVVTRLVPTHTAGSLVIPRDTFHPLQKLLRVNTKTSQLVVNLDPATPQNGCWNLCWTGQQLMRPSLRWLLLYTPSHDCNGPPAAVGRLCPTYQQRLSQCYLVCDAQHNTNGCSHACDEASLGVGFST